jgi:hypothetical protein
LNAQSPWLERPVLVYGPRKAGTTLLQNLLDGTKELAVYPSELKLKYFVKGPREGRLVDQYRARTRIGEIASPHFSFEKYQSLWRNEADASLGDLIRRDIQHVVAACDHPIEPKLWAAKEVGGRTDAILAEWRGMFPQGRVLFILRDPAMITRAVLNDRRRKERRLSAFQIARETIDPLRVVSAEARHLRDPATFAIAYEDLVGDTAATMRRVAAFLEIPLSDVLTRPTLFGEPVVVRTASRPEAGVFQSEVQWHEGLTARERRIVAITTQLARLGGLSVDYPALRARVSMVD